MVDSVRRVLELCVEMIQQNPSGETCYCWVRQRFKEKYGGTFHHAIMKQLAAEGYLTRSDLASGGARRYYRLPHTTKIASYPV